MEKITLWQGVEKRYIETDSGRLYLPDFSKTPDVIGKYLRKQMLNKNRKVIFLFDSISYLMFKKHFRQKIDISNLDMYNSNFPPNTYNVYPSIFFGVQISKHKIPGTAFYNGEGLLNLMSNKVYKLDGNKLTIKKAPWDSALTPFPYYSKNAFLTIVPDKKWLQTQFWKRMFYSKSLLSVKRVGSLDEYDYSSEFLLLMNAVSRAIKNTKYNIITYIDFDEIMHMFGVEKANTQKLINLVADLISNIVEHNEQIDYFFVSDHGHISQKSVHNAELLPISKTFYCADGGAGRTRYFYTKSPEAFEYIRDLVGNTGVVVHRGNRILNRLYGFETKEFYRIGDIVAIATKPNFPSHGWNFVGEHGGTSIEEYSIPFLHLTKRT